MLFRSGCEPRGVSVRIGLFLRFRLSCRVSIPKNLRLIGSARPPRPCRFRRSSWCLLRGGVTVYVHLPLVLLVMAFEICPPSPSLRGDSREPGHGACLLRSWVPTTPANPPFTRPPGAILRSLFDRPRLPPSALRVVQICRPCLMPVRPWAPSLQRFLPAVAARPSRVVLSSLPFIALRRRGFEDFSCHRVA